MKVTCKGIKSGIRTYITSAAGLTLPFQQSMHNRFVDPRAQKVGKIYVGLCDNINSMHLIITIITIFPCMNIYLAILYCYVSSVITFNCGFEYTYS